LGGGSFVERDIPPFITGYGNRFRVKNINIVGLKRRGFSREEISDVLQAHALIFRSGKTKVEYLEALKVQFPDSVHIKRIRDFISRSEKGICGSVLSDESEH
jgi:UDP-N-acetylglucosamine acyltransferase